jgi:hypothetical protein
MDTATSTTISGHIPRRLPQKRSSPPRHMRGRVIDSGVVIGLRQDLAFYPRSPAAGVQKQGPPQAASTPLSPQWAMKTGTLAMARM